MSKVSGKDTKPEKIVRKYLFENGFRFLKNDKRLPGKPDIVLPRHRTVVFVHGCFWHGHTCKKGKLPSTRIDFWRKKISASIERDKRNINSLVEDNWTVFIIWECELNTIESRNSKLELLSAQILATSNM